MIKKPVIFLYFLLAGFNSFAQWQDFGLWTEISLEKKISPRWEVSLTESIRLNENVTALNQHYTHLSGTYKISKAFSLTLAYRNSQRFNFDETIDFRHRAQLEAAYKHKLGQLGIELQERFQIRYDNIRREAGWEIPQIYYRTRLTLDYDLDSRFTPFASAEIFLNQSRYIDNLRLRAGFDYDFNKKNSVRLYYMIDQDLQENDPLRFFAIGLGYKFSF
ncbi:MAG: hypothetical protein K0R65_188 [Crocinitomicaceae bacterium]|jgi:hypothetical protein|nr:hypothetical protein [Crocinitomicaceae bacterium]